MIHLDVLQLRVHGRWQEGSRHRLGHGKVAGFPSDIRVAFLEVQRLGVVDERRHARRRQMRLQFVASLTPQGIHVPAMGAACRGHREVHRHPRQPRPEKRVERSSTSVSRMTVPPLDPRAWECLVPSTPLPNAATSSAAGRLPPSTTPAGPGGEQWAGHVCATPGMPSSQADESFRPILLTMAKVTSLPAPGSRRLREDAQPSWTAPQPPSHPQQQCARNPPVGRRLGNRRPLKTPPHQLRQTAGHRILHVQGPYPIRIEALERTQP